MSERTSKATTAVRKAWKNEQRLVSEGRVTRDWTPEQQRDILDPKIGAASDENNEVFRGHHMQSVELFPQYQGDPENIQFLSKEEHLKAHDGSFRILTNWYYNPVTEKKEPFEDDKYKPCKIIYLSNPVCPPKPIVDEIADNINEKVNNTGKNQKEDKKENKGEAIPEISKTNQTLKESIPESTHESVNTDVVAGQDTDTHDPQLFDEDMNARKAVELGFADGILFSEDEEKGDDNEKEVEDAWQPYSTRAMGQAILNRLIPAADSHATTGEAAEHSMYEKVRQSKKPSRPVPSLCRIWGKST